MKERFAQLVASKTQVQVNFPASAGGKLISASGTIKEVFDDYMVMNDIYGNSMIIPYVAIAYVEVKK